MQNMNLDSSAFKNIFQKAPVALMVLNSEGRIQLFNEHAQKLFKYLPDEIKNAPVEILISPNLRAMHMKDMKDFFNNLTSQAIGDGKNICGIDKEGTEIPIKMVLNSVTLNDKDYVIASAIDLTKQIQEENKFRDAVEAAPNAMLTINSEGLITMINQQCEQLFQYSRDELLGSPVEVLVPDQFKLMHPSHIKKYLKNPASRSMGAGRDLFGRKKDGTLFPAEIGLRPLLTGSDVSVISSIVDISERVKNKKEILERNQELQEFAYRASHDLKAPLVSIAGLSELVIEDLESKNYDTAIANINHINNLSLRLKNFVDDILSLTKSEHLQGMLTPFSFENCLNSIKNKLEDFISKSKTNIVLSCKHKRDLKTQSIRLNQVLENLISNAIKYADDKKDRKVVNITTYNDDNVFYITVSDNGVGIPKECHHRVFGMFSRFHNDSVPGSGLGLYLVKKHVDKLGGSIAFESSEKGTSFFLRLPLGSQEI